MLTKEQVEQRINYLGGGDISAILGLSRYRTALQVWASKTNQVDHKDISQQMPVRMGNLLEGAVCQLFTEETGKVIKQITEKHCQKLGLKYKKYINKDGEEAITVIHPKYPFIGGNLDGIVEGENAMFEAKTTNSFKQSDWEDDKQIPIEYQIQVHHYLAITKFDRAYVACLIGNRKFVWRVIERDQKLLDELIEKEVAFWNTFIVPTLAGTLTMPMASASDSGLLYALYPKAAPESVIELDDEAQKICELRDSTLVDIKSSKLQAEEYSNRLKAMLKTHDVGMTARYRITWKNQKERKFDFPKFKIDEPGLYDKYTPETEKRVMNVRVRKI